MELSEMTDVAAILKGWEDEQNQANYNPVPTLTRYFIFAIYLCNFLPNFLIFANL